MIVYNDILEVEPTITDSPFKPYTVFNIHEISSGWGKGDGVFGYGVGAALTESQKGYTRALNSAQGGGAQSGNGAGMGDNANSVGYTKIDPLLVN